MRLPPPVPVAIFAYARPDHVRALLACLRQDGVPQIHAFSDAPRGEQDAARVAEVRAILKEVDWCRMQVTCRESNLGLGASILSGVTEVLEKYEAVLVLEDDLVFAPGTYAYFCAALDRYRDEEGVMSVAGHTHPRVRPGSVRGRPYFDGRFACWGWGTWRRAWVGMERNAASLMEECCSQGISPSKYGWDLPAAALAEKERNIWAVRFTYLHLLKGGLCLRPPEPWVNHTGCDDVATNAGNDVSWNVALPLRAEIPTDWPVPREEPVCARLWRRAYPWHRLVAGARLASTADRLRRKTGHFILGGIRKIFGIDLSRARESA